MHFRAVLLCVFLMFASFASRAAEPGSDLFAAIKQNDMPRLRALVAGDPTVLATRNAQGLSPLMFAAYYERPEMVAFLHGKDTDLDFYEACVSGDKTAVKRFLALGQDIEQRHSDGFTALGLSVFFKQPEIARLLIDAGANVDAQATNTLRVAPIHAAVARSDLATLQLLLLKGADPNLAQQRLMRPLHEAAAAGNLPIVAMLLMFGADPTTRNEEGKTAADFAREKGNSEIADRLDALSRSSR